MRRSRLRSLRTALASQPSERAAAHDGIRRRAYVLTNLIGMAVQAAIWGLEVRHPTGDLGTLYFNPVFFAMCGFFVVWLSRGRPIITTERVGLGVFALVVLFRIVSAPLAGSAHFLGLLQDTYWLIMIASVISFLVFDFRPALLGSIGLYLAGVLVPWLLLWGRYATALDGAWVARLAQAQLLPGIALVIMWSLAWYREHFVLERRLLQLAEKLARSDALTGLANRHALYPRLGEAVQNAQPGAPHSLLLLDLDHFKAVNDQHGHNVGDAVLAQAALLLEAQLTGSELLGRWGGEEFLVLTLSPATHAEALARQLGEQLAQHDFTGVGAGVGPVTASIGVAACRPGDTLQGWLSRADRALYQAKRQGRNRVCSAEHAGAEQTGEVTGSAGERQALTAPPDERLTPEPPLLLPVI